MARTYPPDKIDEALIAYRLTGNTRRAEQETGIAFGLIAKWARDTHAARYKELSDKYGPYLEAQLVSRMQDIADRAADVASRAVQATDDAVQAGNARDAAAMSNTVKNLVLSTGIATDKALLLQGRPTEIHANQSSDDDLKAIARMLHVTLEGTATEITNPDGALHARTRTSNPRELSLTT